MTGDLMFTMEEKAASMAEFSAWSDEALGGTSDWGAGGHEIRGCVTPDAGPTAPRRAPAKLSRAWTRRAAWELDGQGDEWFMGF